MCRPQQVSPGTLLHKQKLLMPIFFLLQISHLPPLLVGIVMTRKWLKMAGPRKMNSFMVTQTEVLAYIWRLVHLVRNLMKLIQPKRIRKRKHTQAVAKIGRRVHRQKMRGVESGLGEIDTEAVIQMVIHPVTIEIDIVAGQKGKRKDPLGRKAVAAENIQNIIRGEAGILQPDLDTRVTENMEKPRERSGKRGIEHEDSAAIEIY